MSGIQMALLGSGGPRVNFTNQSVAAVNSGAPAIASYRISSDGFDYEGQNGSFTALTNWVVPASDGGNYEVFATLTSGAITNGTVNNWLATSTTRTWTCTALSSGFTAFAALSFQVRAVGSATVLDTWTVNLEAERI